ncbi:Fic family protein [Aquincola sp. S2]|uniref:Fic family protein n=1 Tax=Pseudaquabacterium terrae TaxID=2732868 RepID=A0ABX2EKX3_9BURK|nr:Fic family protein [Aquabacterium terrae]NRF69263.1 Fic family protein [Aquabacterium terrae]
MKESQNKPQPKLRLFDEPTDMEPLLPRESVLHDALAMAHDLRTEAARLSGMCRPNVSDELAVFLRAMNSYYSNKIEGQHTRPLDLERALHADFSADLDKARLQRLALAHIETEQWIAGQQWSTATLYAADTVTRLHEHLFGQLSEADRTHLDKTSGDVIVTAPGHLRERNVSVSRHVAPAINDVPAMLERWSVIYGSARRGEMQVVAAAASHHRLAWIHPFIDGNGRAARLHTLAVLRGLGLTDGLWSPLRGLARGADAYAEKLANADMARAGDLDGRGQRSERFLVEWIEHFIAVCLDQVRFMTGLLDLAGVESRLAALLAHEQHTVKSGVRIEALRPLHYLFATQRELDRRDFAAMTGLGERTASGLIAALLKRALLRSDTPRGPLRFAVPLHALRLLFPNLWPEAEADAAQNDGRPRPDSSRHSSGELR